MHKIQIVMTFVTPKGNEKCKRECRSIHPKFLHECYEAGVINTCDSHEMIFYIPNEVNNFWIGWVLLIQFFQSIDMS